MPSPLINFLINFETIIVFSLCQMTQHSKLLCLAFLLLVICARGTWGHVRCLYNPPACTTKHYYYNASSHQCRSITASVNCTQRVSASQENAFNTLMECTELCVEGETCSLSSPNPHILSLSTELHGIALKSITVFEKYLLLFLKFDFICELYTQGQRRQDMVT